MAYRFKLHEGFGAGLVRIGLEQIELAAHGLAASGDATGIHEARKCLKRIRALLRLVRPGLGDDVFRRENARFREIAKLLSGARDLHVLMQTLLKLEARHNLAGSRFLGHLKHTLAAKQQHAAEAVEASKVGDARRLLKQAARDFKRLRLKPDNFNPIGGGLNRSYRGCRAAFAAAYDARSDAAFHEWRKSVQQHWRQMRLLHHAWPEYSAARAKAARELSEILGEDHDCGVLKAYIGGEARPVLRPGEAARLKGLCRARQQELRAAARPRGARLLAEGPNGLTRRIGCFWQAATQIPEEPVEHGDGGGARRADVGRARRRRRKPRRKQSGTPRSSGRPRQRV
jgi:CHAD domain-containing protein